MAGLLGDGFGYTDPGTLLAAGLLRGTGNLGANLATGLLGAQQSAQANREFQMLQEQALVRRQLMQAQLEQAQRQNSIQAAMDAAAKKNVIPGQPQMQPTDYETPSGPAGPSSFNLPGYARDVMGINPQAGIALQAQLAALSQKNLQKLGPGDTLYDVGANKTLFSAPDKLPPGMVPGPNGPEYMPAYLAGQKDIRNAGATRVQTNVNAFTPASEAAQTEFMKSSRSTYDQLKLAPQAIANIEQAKALIPSAKGFMGPGGEGMLQAAKFLNNRLGTQIDIKGIKSAEELRSRIFFNIMDNLKKMDAQPSQMQQAVMMDSLGKLGTDPNALPDVLSAYEDAIRGKVDLYNREVQGAVKRGVKFPYDPLINMETPKPGGGGVIDFKDLP